MTVTLREIVDVLWPAMGLSPPTERIGDSYSFTVEETDITLRLDADEQSAVMEAGLGRLSSDAFTAGDQLRRLARISLALSPYNRAAPVLPVAQDGGWTESLRLGWADFALGVVAVARIERPLGRSAPAALQDVMQLQALTLPILDRPAAAETPDLPDRTGPAADEAAFVIFQP